MLRWVFLAIGERANCGDFVAKCRGYTSIAEWDYPCDCDWGNTTVAASTGATPTLILTLNSPTLVTVTPVPLTTVSGGGVTPPPLPPTFMSKPLTLTPTFTFMSTRTPTTTPSSPTSTPCVPISKCILVRSDVTIIKSILLLTLSA